jgi:hypothetical protein
VLKGLPPRVVFVDPGTTKGHGCAEFWTGPSGHGETSETIAVAIAMVNGVVGGNAQHAVVEMPVEAFGGTVNTIINLARAAERAVAAYTIRGQVTYIHPSGTHAWKRGSKVQHQYNAWHALTDAEQQRVAEFAAGRKLRGLDTPTGIRAKLEERCKAESKSEWLLGNVLDAVYMGCWAYGRIDEFGRY